MTLRDLGASYFKTWKGKALLAITLVVALVFVCFFADTLARNTYVPKEGKSVIDTIYAETSPAEQAANQLQLSKAYSSLIANQKEWNSQETGLTDGIFCVTTQQQEYIVYNIDSENIAEEGKTFKDYNHIWIDSGNDSFYAVLNISGKNIDLTDYYIIARDESGVYGSRTVLNFYEAEQINITDAIVMGTILAPNAEVICDNASVYGQLQTEKISGEINYHKDLRFTGYKNVMNNLNVITLKNDSVRIAAIEYLINHDPDGKYSDYTISSAVRVRDIHAVKKLSIHAPGVTYDSLEEDLAQFPNLEEISISGGVLPTFSLENMPGIKALSIVDTTLAEINISPAIDLEHLVLDNNTSLKTLDFTQNAKIEVLSYSGTPLGWMDYSYLPNLYYLDCSYSSVKAYLTISGENLQNVRTLDISGNGEIQTFAINTFPMLERVNCSRCCILNLDFSNSQRLTYFKGSNNRLTNIDFRGAVNLQYIEVYGNTVQSIDIRGLKPLNVYCNVKMITDEGEVYMNGFEPPQQSSETTEQ